MKVSKEDGCEFYTLEAKGIVTEIMEDKNLCLESVTWAFRGFCVLCWHG